MGVVTGAKNFSYLCTGLTGVGFSRGTLRALSHASVTAFSCNIIPNITMEEKKTVQITLEVEEDMVELVKLVLPRIRGVVSFS